MPARWRLVKACLCAVLCQVEIRKKKTACKKEKKTRPHMPKIRLPLSNLEERSTCQTSAAEAEMHYQAIFNSLSADNPICRVPDRTLSNGKGGRVLQHNVQIANQLPVHMAHDLPPCPLLLFFLSLLYSRPESCSRDIAQSLAACFLSR